MYTSSNLQQSPAQFYIIFDPISYLINIIQYGYIFHIQNHGCKLKISNIKSLGTL